jgi:hypothetical protein
MSARRMSSHSKLILAAGLAVGLALGGTGLAAATWSTTNSATGSVTAAALSTGAIGGAAALDSVVYRAAGTPSIATLTLTNNGIAPLALTLTGSSTGSATLAGQITLSTWAQVAGSCGAVVPTTGTSAALLSSATFGLPVSAQSAAAGATVTFCAATTFGGATIAASQGFQLAETITLAGAVGTWTTRSSTTFGQSVYQVGNPTVPVCKQAVIPYGALLLQQQSATISWTAPSVPTGTVSYTIVDATTLAVVSTVTVSGTSATFVNGNLNAASENLLVRAKDSALGTTSTGLAFTLSQTGGVLGLLAVSASCVTPAVSP